MRKDRISGLLILSVLFLIPFGINAKAQVPDYVGVNVGDQFTWKAKVNFGNVDDLLDNVRDLLADWKANLPSIDLFGFESLTPAEIIEQIATGLLSNFLPVGWESLNVTDLIEATIVDHIEQFNSTILSGMIPSNWQTLNFTDFYDLVFDGINGTLAPGWEDNPFQDLYAMLMNEINSTINYGLIPANWEELSMIDFYKAMVASVPLIGESFAVHMMLESMVPSFLPIEIQSITMGELFDNVTALFGMPIMNATTLFNELFLGLNQTMPGGMESELMADVLDFFGEMANSTMPSGYGALNASELLKYGSEALVNMTGMPQSLQILTLTGWLDYGFTEALTLLDTMIIPEWDTMYLTFQAMGMLSYEAGLRVKVISIGTEVAAFPGGPMGVPIGMNLSFSLDFETWESMSSITGLSLSTITTLPSDGFFMNSFFPVLTLPTYIVDPSTYSIAPLALLDQFILSGTLIVANNYDWNAVQTDLTFATTQNPTAIVLSVEWNANGILERADIKAGGLVVAEITLIGAEGEIPGYEIPLILGFAGFTVIAIILYGKKKNKSI